MDKKILKTQEERWNAIEWANDNNYRYGSMIELECDFEAYSGKIKKKGMAKNDGKNNNRI